MCCGRRVGAPAVVRTVRCIIEKRIVSDKLVFNVEPLVIFHARSHQGAALSLM